jgi:flotillin
MTDSTNSNNSYLDQVQQQQQALEQNLKARRQKLPMSAAPVLARQQVMAEVAQPTGNAVEVRITGFGRWKTVIVPPNAHVVHTRRGHAEPLHLGLGVSFPYNPNTDAFLVVPGAMQTILINAKCICRERQGVLVQGYVQWIVQDFATAYRKLDFSDVEEPMRLVNLQLKEQAEAAIKDKVATMSIDDVLADKQPIIEELTTRLRSVAEGVGGSDKGLGLRIVTVQIKEAVVSSSRLWESLQKPFRAERARLARLAEIEADESIAARELEARRARDSAQVAVDRELATTRSAAEVEAFDRSEAERIRRASAAQESARALAAAEHTTALSALELSRARHTHETELARAQAEFERVKTEGELLIELARAQNDLKREELRIAAAEQRQRIENQLSPAALHARALEALPGIVEKLPRPDELRSVTIGPGGDGLSSAVAQVLALLQALREQTPAR